MGRLQSSRSRHLPLVGLSTSWFFHRNMGSDKVWRHLGAKEENHRMAPLQSAASRSLGSGTEIASLLVQDWEYRDQFWTFGHDQSPLRCLERVKGRITVSYSLSVCYGSTRSPFGFNFVCECPRIMQTLKHFVPRFAGSRLCGKVWYVGAFC